MPGKNQIFLFLLMLVVSITGCAQFSQPSAVKSTFDTAVSGFMKRLKSDGVEKILVIERHDFVDNTALFVWESGKSIKAMKLFNPKKSKRLKSRKIKIEDEARKSFGAIIGYQHWEQFKVKYGNPCSKGRHNSYRFKFSLRSPDKNSEEFTFHSNCIDSFNENELELLRILKLVDQNYY